MRISFLAQLRTFQEEALRARIALARAERALNTALAIGEKPANMVVRWQRRDGAEKHLRKVNRRLAEYHGKYGLEIAREMMSWAKTAPLHELMAGVVGIERDFALAKAEHGKHPLWWECLAESCALCGEQMHILAQARDQAMKELEQVLAWRAED